jgi:hypothetical protein
VVAAAQQMSSEMVNVKVRGGRGKGEEALPAWL